MNFDKIQWKTIESYFLSNPYNLTQHHLNSYNNFFDNEIFQIIKEKNPIKITKNFDETLDDFKFKVDIYIGGINGDKLYYGKPIIYDENQTHYMYPNEARLRNMNYGFTVHYDVLVKSSYDEIKKLLSWLEWDWDEAYLHPHLSHREIATASSSQARYPINNKSIGGWHNYTDLLKPAIEFIESKDN